MNNSHRNDAWMFAETLRDVRMDLRYAVRHCLRAPLVTGLIVATLAIGIGANTTMATLVNALLLTPPPGIAHPDDVVRFLLVTELPGRPKAVLPVTSYSAVMDFQREATEFESVAGYSTARLSFGQGADAVPIQASLVSRDFFRVLRAPAFLGRWFGAADGLPIGDGSGGVPLAVLSYDFWTRQFGGTRSAVGQRASLARSSAASIVRPAARGRCGGIAPRAIRG